MTDHGLLFKADLVRAFLAGRKTMTRRLVTRSTVVGVDGKRFSEGAWRSLCLDEAERIVQYTRPLQYVLSVPVYGSALRREDRKRVELTPQWHVGDTIWARETWAAAYQQGCWGTLFRADGVFEQGARKHDKGPYYDPDNPANVTWCSPLYLPRWASRLRFDVTDVRIERLQDITDADAKAEGVSSATIPADEDAPERIGFMLGPNDGRSTLYPDRVTAFAKGWDAINGERATWASNPWVSVIGLARRP